MRLSTFAFAILSTTACSHASEAQRVDSLVLERTPCFGTCPAYRLALSRAGAVSFGSRNRGDTSRIIHDSVPSATLAVLVTRAERIRFATLPDTVARDRVLCSDQATDHPTIIISLFGDRSKQVVYYTGCYVQCCEHARAGILQELAAFATAIDSATQAQRWIRPGRVR